MASDGFEKNVLEDLCLLGNNEWPIMVLWFEMQVFGCSGGRFQVLRDLGFFSDFRRFGFLA